MQCRYAERLRARDACAHTSFNAYATITSNVLATTNVYVAHATRFGGLASERPTNDIQFACVQYAIPFRTVVVVAVAVGMGI